MLLKQCPNLAFPWIELAGAGTVLATNELFLLQPIHHCFDVQVQLICDLGLVELFLMIELVDSAIGKGINHWRAPLVVLPTSRT